MHYINQADRYKAAIVIITLVLPRLTKCYIRLN